MFKGDEEIKQDMLDNISNTQDKSQNSFIHDAVAGTAVELAGFYMWLDHLKGKFDINNLESEELDVYIYQQTGLKRKAATYATVTLLFTGTAGVTIDKGALASVGDVIYETLESKVTDSSGEVLIEAKAQEQGISGNVPSGAINDFPIAINEIISVTNPEPVTNGYDAEEDEAYLERYFRRVRAPITSGNKHHYLTWALEVVGVGGARIKPLWNGDNTVKVTIINSNKEPADSLLIKNVQEYIDPNSSGLGLGRAPIGAFTTVVSAVGKDIDVSANVIIDDKNELADVQRMIEENITSYLRDSAFKESIISYAKLGAIILSTESVLDYSNLKVNQGTVSITVEEDEVAVLGGVELIA